MTIIAGVDAGTTIAVAIVDFEGNAVCVRSRKHWKEGEVVKFISSFSPHVVACDTNPTSGFAKSISRAFGAKLHFPKRHLRVMEKERMAAGKWKCANKHERDALAAALKAYHHFENKLRQVRRKAGWRDGLAVAAIQGSVVRGEKMAHAMH
ncbi:DUF460 domain-containing protein [Candidatus Micrarchaeota archaeon]|nr:DUF460 domain-containing protein [Candidatus Micrarchaeota archaeon]MBI5177276.1 DUF460 domain-containing protein [Candidatus Micrarchaeota archaeon]